MGWSNDQLNAIYVYNASTGALLLSVDQKGLYLANSADGSYFKVESRHSTIGVQDIIAVELQPPNSVIAGVTYSFAELVADENLLSAGHAIPELVISSPYSTGKMAALINLQGQSNTSAADDSVILLSAAFLLGKNGSQIGQGTLDSGANYATASFTGTEIAADYCAEAVGVMVTTRVYEGRWTGTMQSSVSGDKIGLRLYTGPTKNSLVGATQLFDYGQTTIGAANTAQPFFVDTEFVGVPGKFFILGARRASGTGTCILNIGQRKLSDISGT